MLPHPQRALSACTTGGILQSPSLILRCFYKGRGRGVFLSLCQFPVETGFQRMVTQGLARSLDGTGTLKARLFPMPLCVTHSGSQENCLHSMSLGSSHSVTPPVKCLLSLSSLNCSPTSSHLVCPTQASCHYTPITFLPPHHHQSLSSPTDFSYASHLCLLLSAENCPPASSMIRNVFENFVLLLSTMIWDLIYSEAEVFKRWSANHLLGWLNIQLQEPHPRSSVCKSQALCICDFNKLPRHHWRVQSLRLTAPYYLICSRKQNGSKSNLDLHISFIFFEFILFIFLYSRFLLVIYFIHICGLIYFLFLFF